MEIETNEMFWDKLKNILKETFSKKEEEPAAEPAEIEPTNIDLEAEPTPAPEPAPEPVSEPSEPVAEPQPVVEPTPAPEPVQEPKNEPVEPQPNPLEDLVKSLKDEIEALKGYNSELQNKVKDMEKQPSAQPINVNSKPNNGDTYAQWRAQMREMLGR